jgi:hypothetical protein
VEVCHTLCTGGGRQEETPDVVVDSYQTAQVGGWGLMAEIDVVA